MATQKIETAEELEALLGSGDIGEGALVREESGDTWLVYDTEDGPWAVRPPSEEEWYAHRQSPVLVPFEDFTLPLFVTNEERPPQATGEPRMFEPDATGAVTIDTADLSPEKAAAVGYALRVRQHVQTAREATFDGRGKGMIGADSARYVSTILDVLDGWVMRDLADIAGIEVPEGHRVADAFDVGEEAPGV